MSSYLPPDTSSILFKFTKSGYVKPDTSDVDFNFGVAGNFVDLNSSIDILQLSLDSATTGLKTNSGVLVIDGTSHQYIDGKNYYEGYRDFILTISPGASLFYTINSYINPQSLFVDKEYTETKYCDNFAILGGNNYQLISDRCRSYGIRDIISSILPDFFFDKESTKLKYCDEFLVLDGTGHQVINNRCYYEGLRDLNSYIKTYREPDGSSYVYSIIGVRQTTFNDLLSYIYCFLPDNKGIGVLNSSIDIHTAVDISSYVDVNERQQDYLYSLIASYDTSDVLSDIKTHDFVSLFSATRPVIKSSSDIDSFVHSYDVEDINSFIDRHSPERLRTAIRPIIKDTKDIDSYLYGYDIKDLTSTIKQHQPSDINSYIGTHKYDRVRSAIRAWSEDNMIEFPGTAYGWEERNLYSDIKQHNYEKINSRLKVWVYEETSTITSLLRVFEQSDLYSNIGGHTFGNISSRLKSIVYGASVELPGTTYGWEERDIGGYIFVLNSPQLLSNIRGWNRQNTNDIVSNLYGWAIDDLNSAIDMHLPSYINSTILQHVPEDLNSNIKVYFRGAIEHLNEYLYGWESSDIHTHIDLHKPYDINSAIKVIRTIEKDVYSSLHSWDLRDINSFIDKHDPSILYSYARAKAQGYGDVYSDLFSYAYSDLQSVVAYHSPEIIRSYIEGEISTEAYIYSDLYGYASSYLYSYISSLRLTKHGLDNIYSSIFGGKRTEIAYINSAIATELPVDIDSYVSVNQRSVIDFYSDIHGFEHRYLDSFLRGVVFDALNTHIDPIATVYLYSYLKIWPQEFLYSKVTSYGESYLYSYAKVLLDSYIDSVISSHSHVNIYSIVKPSNSFEDTISSNVQTLHEKYINSSLSATYINDLQSYIGLIEPGYLYSGLFSYAYSDLMSVLTAAGINNYINSYINADYSRHSFINSDINSVKQANVSSDIDSVVHGYNYNDLYSSIIYSDNFSNIYSSISIKNKSDVLYSYIKADRVFVYKILSICTIDHRDLRSVINSACFGTSFSQINSYLKCYFQDDIVSTVKGVKDYPYNSDLYSIVGYDNSYKVVDKFDIDLNLITSYVYTVDKFNININLFSGSKSLSSFVKAEPHNSYINSDIFARPLDYYNFNYSNSRQRVTNTIDKESDRSLVFETVELVFDEKVDEYLFNASEGKSYEYNIDNKWLLEFRSFMPEDKRIGSKRKLRKIARMHDISNFSNIDEALSFYIAKVTNRLKSDINSAIIPKGFVSVLNSNIKARGTVSSKSMLYSDISAINRNVVLSYGGSLSFL